MLINFVFEPIILHKLFLKLGKFFFDPFLLKHLKFIQSKD